MSRQQRTALLTREVTGNPILRRPHSKTTRQDTIGRMGATAAPDCRKADEQPRQKTLFRLAFKATIQGNTQLLPTSQSL